MATKSWTIRFGTRTGDDGLVHYFADIYVGDAPSAYLDSFSAKHLMEKIGNHLKKQAGLRGFWE